MLYSKILSDKHFLVLRCSCTDYDDLFVFHVLAIYVCRNIGYANQAKLSAFDSRSCLSGWFP